MTQKSIEELVKKMWSEQEKFFVDSERNRNLREDIVKRMLATCMTDDERAAYFGLPEGCRIREGAKIISPKDLKCGNYVWIGENAILDASGGLEIGDHASIGLSVFIWSHTSPMTNLCMENFSGSSLIERKRTRIGSGVFIGGPSVIYPGVTIGDKVIVAPNSVVTKDIPSYSIVGGSPARVIKQINEEYIQNERQRILSKNSHGGNS